MKKADKNTASGITLVALVVTIIILIILATISIRMVIGEGGLIWQANNAKVEYRAATVDEEVLSWKAEKQVAEFNDKVQPKTRDELIDDQLERGLLTQEEADTAKKEGKVKIGSRVIDYGEDSGVPSIPDGGDGQEGTIKYSDFSWPSVGTAQVTVTKNAKNDYSMEYQVYDSVEAEQPKQNWTPIESGNKIENLTLGNVVKTAFTDGNGRYGKTADFTVNDNTKPEDSIVTFSVKVVDSVGNVEATIKISDKESGIDLTKSKWAFTNSSTAIGESGTYSGEITSEEQTIPLKKEIGGTHYLHILSVDKAENKKETTIAEATLKELYPTLQDSTVQAEDKMKNKVVIPGKFKIAQDSGDSVQEGVIIEDGDGNQFVWIPVSNIDGNTSLPNNKPIIKDDNSTATITLARYTFNETDGTPTEQQYASNYKNEIKINFKDNNFIEMNIPGRLADQTNDYSTVNATALNLEDFVHSVKTNHGYYIGRYEASYGSGNTFGVGADSNYYKPLVQPSTGYYKKTWDPGGPPNSSAPLAPVGTLWNRITQGNAALASRNMYNEIDDEADYITSDLMNSYAWDTAIVYIQAMGNSNYANQNPLSTSLKNTGETGDEKCHIFDMAGNVSEWTTEYCDAAPNPDLKIYARPGVYRGGNFKSTLTTDYRMNSIATIGSSSNGFRPELYIK